MNNLEVVAIFHEYLPKRRTRNDFEIAFDGNAKGIKPKAVHHLRDIDAARNAPMFAIDPD